MRTLSEIQGSAMQLPEDQRAQLASSLLEWLPAILHDDDGGVSEALRRDAELEENPPAGITLNMFRFAFEK